MFCCVLRLVRLRFLPPLEGLPNPAVITENETFPVSFPLQFCSSRVRDLLRHLRLVIVIWLRIIVIRPLNSMALVSIRKYFNQIGWLFIYFIHTIIIDFVYLFTDISDRRKRKKLICAQDPSTPTSSVMVRNNCDISTKENNTSVISPMSQVKFLIPCSSKMGPFLRSLLPVPQLCTTCNNYTLMFQNLYRFRSFAISLLVFGGWGNVSPNTSVGVSDCVFLDL